jgi:two-component system nitrate/nitrite response regulator NarL
VKILVVDDHVLFREGLVSLLKSDDYFNVVGQAGSVHEAINLAHTLRPDLILMDFSLPDGDGAEASTAILAERPECKIVFLTMHDDDENLFAAIRSGAKGYLLKNVPVAKLISSLKSIEKGEAAISRTMTMRLLEEFSQHHNGVSSEVCNTQSVLSQREVEILREIALGASNGEIATKLFLSVNTVKHHIHNILSKLRLENRRAAILYAQQAGLIKPIK